MFPQINAVRTKSTKHLESQERSTGQLFQLTIPTTVKIRQKFTVLYQRWLPSTETYTGASER